MDTCSRRISPGMLSSADEKMDSISEILQCKTPMAETDGYSSVGYSFRLLVSFYRMMGLFIYSRASVDNKGTHFVFSWKKTWLTLVYSLTLWSLVSVCLVVSTYTFFVKYSAGDVSIRQLFHISLIIYRSTTYLLSAMVMVCQAPNLVKLVRNMIRLEKDIQLEKCELRNVLLASVVLVVFQFVVAVRGAVMIVMIIGFQKINLFHLVNYPKCNVPLNVAAVIWAVVTSYGQTMVQGTLIFVCCFFKVCFKKLNKEIETIGYQKVSYQNYDHETEFANKLMNLRLLYERVTLQVTSWQSRISLAILVSYTANLVLCCFGISIAITDTERQESLLFVELFILALLHLILPTIASGFMKHEADKTKQVLNLLTIKYKNRQSLYDEITTFRLTLRSEIVVFSGAGLFDLDFPLILSVFQSIITYAVLLLQTTNTQMPSIKANDTLVIEEAK